MSDEEILLYYLGRFSDTDQKIIAYLIQYHDTLFQFNMPIPKIGIFNMVAKE